jgi:glycosyltransferase involved in cell wall biosynthesis
VTTELANGLARRGHGVVLLVPAGRDEAFYPVAKEVSLKRPKVLVPALADTNIIGGILRRFAILCALEPADAAVVTPNLDAFVLYIGSRLVKIKTPVYFSMCYEPFSGGDLAPNLRRLRKFLAALSYRLPLARVVISTAIRDRIQETHGSTFVVANPGVDTAVFRPLQPKTASSMVRILTFGSTEARRDFGVFLKAMDLVYSRRQNIEVWILPRDEASYSSARYPVRLVSAPTDDDLADVYSAVDIFVSTSFWEGYGLPPLEAMACGTACVISDSGGVRDFARDAENCLLVPARSAEAVAAAVVKLIDQPELRSRLGAKGVETAALFSWERMVDVIERICSRSEPGQVAVGDLHPG